jgi:dolichol-phosphate mannosyltransferase
MADELADASNGRMHVLHRPGKSGLGRAYVAGFTWALDQGGYNAVVEMDADLSHDPAAIPQLLAEVSHADLVIGSRYLNGISVINWPLRRIMLSLGANEYVRRITGMPVHDATSGFRVYTARALRAIDIESVHSNGYSFQVEMTYRASISGCRIVESPIVFTERRAGHSKMSKSVIFESAMMPWRLRFQHRAISKLVRAIEPA